MTLGYPAHANPVDPRELNDLKYSHGPAKTWKYWNDVLLFTNGVVLIAAFIGMSSDYEEGDRSNQNQNSDQNSRSDRFRTFVFFCAMAVAFSASALLVLCACARLMGSIRVTLIDWEQTRSDAEKRRTHLERILLFWYQVLAKFHTLAAVLMLVVAAILLIQRKIGYADSGDGLSIAITIVLAVLGFIGAIIFLIPSFVTLH